jgi:GNAT superfamily N-acetyltransferase
LTEGTFDLYWIAVTAEARGSGVAARLDEAVTAEVRQAGGRWLRAETSSTPAYGPAHRFYERRGYTLLERIDDFYRPGDARLTFGKRLDRG